MPKWGTRRLRKLGMVALLGALVVAQSGPIRVEALTTSDAASLYGYPYPNAPDCNEQTAANCETDQWGFVQGQCHSWVAYRLNELDAAELGGETFDDNYLQAAGQEWGGGGHWGAAAAAAGLVVDDNPAPGSVAWWSTNGGHVGYVEAVNGDGTVTMSEMNVDFHNVFDFATLQRGQRWPTGFIHIADQSAVSTVPSPPRNVQATGGDHQAAVTWTIPASNGSPITAFKVTSSPGGKTVSVGAGVNTGTVTGLQNGTSYTFTVHATNANGDSSESAASNAVMPGAVPDRPTNAHATGGNQQATVTWTTPASNGSPITAYKVTASPGGASVTVGAVTSGIVTGLQNGTSYTFTVHATSSAGSSAESVASNAVVPATVPSPPMGVQATAGTQQATVTWTIPASNGSPITAYRVTASPGGASVTVGAVTSGIVTGLQNGASYTFTVHATNAIGNGAESVASNAVVPATVPDPPGNVWATAGNHQASVTWSIPASNGSPITSCQVTAYPGGAAVIVGAGVSWGIVTGLQNGASYTFTVHATNASGSGAESVVSNAVVPATAPNAPPKVHATAGNGRATVSWTAPAGNGSPILSYRVRVTPGGKVVTVAGGAVKAVVTGLRNGTKYRFTVVATNGYGKSGASTASNAVVPASVPDPPTRVRATVGSLRAIVTWIAPPANGSTITGYVIREYSGGRLVKSVSVGRVTRATVSGLRSGVTYRFAVVARNGIGTGPPSAPSPAIKSFAASR